MTGLAIVLGLLAIGIVVAVLITTIFITKRNMAPQTKNNIAVVPSHGIYIYSIPKSVVYITCVCYTHMHMYTVIDSTKSQQKSSSTSAVYENIELPSSSTATREDHMYEHVELRPTTTKHESAAQHEEIELSTNAAYGRVQR